MKEQKNIFNKNLLIEMKIIKNIRKQLEDNLQINNNNNNSLKSIIARKIFNGINKKKKNKNKETIKIK